MTYEAFRVCVSVSERWPISQQMPWPGLLPLSFSLLTASCLHCTFPTPGACSNSCSLSQWCHPTIPSSVVPFSSCLQSFPASGSFPVSQLFASGGQRIGSFSFSIHPSNEYSGLISFRMDWFDLAVQETLKSLLQHHSSKASILWCSAFFMVQLSHTYMTTEAAQYVLNAQ